MTSQYWGDLPPPKITRTDSNRRPGTTNSAGEPLQVDTNAKMQRLSGQSTSKHSRYSSQTEASIPSTLASPTASNFRGDGLAPRPASFQRVAGEAAYNKDYQEKRRQREARNRETYDETPPPAAPDVPRAPPPVSYKQPYSNGAAVSRTRSTRKSEGPIPPTSNEDYFGVAGREDIARRNSKGKGVDRSGAGEMKRTASNADSARRGEWAEARSPLQRLESTLDSITKEEKRARVEEAELLAREGKSSRGGEPAAQNSVRFRNRPVVKAPEPTQNAPQHIADTELARRVGAKPKEIVQRSQTVDERKRPITSGVIINNSGYEVDMPIQTQQEPIPVRGKSVHDRSGIPMAIGAGAAAAGLTRSASNKLKKNPPGDPWFDRRVDAERAFQKVTPVRPPVGDNKHSRGTSSTSYAPGRDKDLPSLPREARAPTIPINNLDLDSDESFNNLPVRRGNSRKIEQLTGEGGSFSKAKPPPQIADIPKFVSQEPHHRHHFPNILHHGNENISGQSIYTSSKRLDEWKKGGVILLDGTLLDLGTAEKTEAEKDKAWWEAGNKGKRRPSTSGKERKAIAYDGEFDENTGMEPHISTDVDCEGCMADRARQSRLASRLARAVRTARNNGNDGGDNLEELGDTSSTPELSQTLKSPVLDSFLPSPISDQTQLLSPVSVKSKEHLLTCPTRAIRVRPDIAPTRFKPALWLKCGPLLRYCGMRREKRQGRVTKDAPRPEREIWRGSVMIVTQDSHSSYELAPTLRLFLQPVDLMPPPPAQVDGGLDELAPEYVDPIAGLPKIGRDGRTLYTRPVEHLEEAIDLSKEETDDGLYEAHRSPLDGATDEKRAGHRYSHYDGEKAGKYKEIRGFRLHAEFGVTFWKFNLEVEMRDQQQRIAYRINRGPATGFWVPARGEAMNIMFHSCNGFSVSVDPNEFSGPDPMWRDVLNTHQTQPFHVMLGGGDQIYQDAVSHETVMFKEWTELKNPLHKHDHPFTAELQEELERFYLNRYSMWFSQGLFGLANSQIPMINIYDDHDIIDGFGSYHDHTMRSAVMCGLGAVAFKYYMLFQHQSSIDEGEDTEPSWILGTEPGPYIHEMSRSIFTLLGRSVAFLGIDCRTERMNDEVLSPETYDKIFARVEDEIVKGETKHLIVLLGVPVAYPRMVWLENVLTSRLMTPVKALLGKGLRNRLDGGVEILDDLDDHWTAKHHKDERAFLIEELQELAAEKSVRITILSGDVHLAAIGQFYSNPELGVPKDRDHRYMPNVISSAIVNTPPPDKLADFLNKRNKIHWLNDDTAEDMIPIFTHDVNGRPRNNKRLLNRRNWCSIREYNPELTPPPTPVDEGSYDGSVSPPVKRGGLFRRFSRSGGPIFRPDAAGGSDRPPLSNTNFFSRRPSFSRSSTERRGSTDSARPSVLTRTLSLTRKDFMPGIFRRDSTKKKRRDDGGINGYGSSESDADSYSDRESQQNARSGMRGGGRDDDDEYSDDDGYFPSLPQPLGGSSKHPVSQAPTSVAGATPAAPKFHRTPTGLSQKQIKRGGGAPVNLEGGLDICLNVEVNPKDPAGITVPYRLLVPRLWYEEEAAQKEAARNMRKRMGRWKGSVKAGKGFGRWADHGHHRRGEERGEERRDGGREEWRDGGREERGERINARGL